MANGEASKKLVSDFNCFFPPYPKYPGESPVIVCQCDNLFNAALFCSLLRGFYCVCSSPCLKPNPANETVVYTTVQRAMIAFLASEAPGNYTLQRSSLPLLFFAISTKIRMCDSNINFWKSSARVIWTLLPSNVAGRTKKSSTGTVLFIAYCRGNCIGA
ncbi:uncharacterized protein BO66DRAFT_444296 [Aspergillus aculeatinus CBS 121060]|uniref:Uncharacterized protein n=1 Tax=Aspergillus aculeatinus CBS 121060 TaxID=1448322 RepID=A0ACD1GSA1_9EURO|nr:hypothetical protein BO66DRAFT_444296 [Aspergillus aculeatinus CBS 121060]RAH64131.1 hypothetical protein BO66DRAFT_444296 [Aspergillus aculeatinus CBS 121060]